MGKTVESYWMALEKEISRWNSFVRALRKDDREAFEEMTFRAYGHERTVGQQKRISTIEKKLGIKQ